MAMVNAFDPSKTGALPAQEAAMIERRRKLLGPAYRLFYEKPLHIVRGDGVWLYDAEGKAYLDTYNNVASVGHCHPHVVEALSRQAALLNTHTRYLHETILDYAERLLGYFPPELSHVMFTCTGSEANDLALRIAMAHTGRQGVIVTRLAYHGLTVAVSELSPSLTPEEPRPAHVCLVDAPDGFRHNGDDVGQRFAEGVRRAIALLRGRGIEPAALLVDTIFSSDGVFADPPGFLVEAVAAIREAGGIFIADEVQPGFGRIGHGFWGFARHGVVPDIVTMGKPMGNGHPMAGIAVRPEVVAEFAARSRYFNTFGGNPVSCAVGLAVLDVIEDHGLVTRAAEMGAILRGGLRDLSTLHPAIGDVRGAGLFVGVEMVDPATGAPATALTTRVVNGLRERGVLISATGPNGNILKIRPPLVFAREHVNLFLDRLAATLQAQNA
ncbi:aspartate aminotransferase family protein [Zavarzinia sp.]|uniref:aspartate aminotransferase family protein n=1 Tax=Zavarzinia sp. TaxID=2027920 RepID=UPI003563678F